MLPTHYCKHYDGFLHKIEFQYIQRCRSNVTAKLKLKSPSSSLDSAPQRYRQPASQRITTLREERELNDLGLQTHSPSSTSPAYPRPPSGPGTTKSNNLLSPPARKRRTAVVEGTVSMSDLLALANSTPKSKR